MPQSQRVTIESSTIQICGKCLSRQQRLHHHSPTIWTSIMSTDSNWMDADAFEGVLWTGDSGNGAPTIRPTSTEDEQYSACRDIQWSRPVHKTKGWHKPRCITKGRPAVTGSCDRGSYIQSCQTFKCQIFKKSDKLSGLVIQAELNDSNSI